MNTSGLEPVLIKAIDGVAKKLSQAERSAESKVSKLLTYWNDMEPADKEQAIGIAIATITTAVTAIVAIRRQGKSPVKVAAKKAVKALAKKVR